MKKMPVRLGVLIALAVLVAVGVVWRLTSSGGDKARRSRDRPADRISKLEQKGDVDTLAVEISNPDVDVACRAVEAVCRAGPKATPHIRRAMRDSRSKVRETAAASMGRVLQEDPSPAPVDMGALARVAREDRSAKVRATAATALGGIYAFEEVEALIEAMEDDSVSVRRRAAAAVARITYVTVGFKADDPLKKRKAAVQRMRKAWADPLVKDRVIEYHLILRSRKKKR